MIEVFGRNIANRMNEITVEEFEKISAIHNNPDFDNIEKQIKVFEHFFKPPSSTAPSNRKRNAAP